MTLHHRLGYDAAALSCVFAATLLVGSCTTPARIATDPPDGPTLAAARSPAPPPAPASGPAAVPAQVSGRVVPATGLPPGPLVRENATGALVAGPPPLPAAKGDGDVTLNYVDTDIREIVRLILGNILHLDYTIDPGLQGVATIQTARPLKREELLATLEGVLEQSGATMVLQHGVFRITPLGNAAIIPPMSDAASVGSGSQVVPLRYASAKQLATMLAPYIGDAGKIIADPTRNVLVVSGSGSARQSLVDLVRVFDVDYLAGQSYALFPVKSGTPAKLAKDLELALAVGADGPLGTALRIVPIDQANAVMVIAQQPRYLDRASRLIAELDRVADSAGRNLHVYFLKNVQAVDLQPVLQRAFNPPRPGSASGESAPGSLPPTAEAAQLAVSAQPGAAGAPNTTIAGGMTAFGGAATPGQTAPGQTTPGQPTPGQATGGTAAGPQPGADTDLTPAVAAAEGAPQIIADRKGNALIVVATEDEYGKIEGAIRRLDILPQQVLIEAAITEVTLNDALQYGTQFYFNNEGNAATLSNATAASSSAATNAALFAGQLVPSLPGFAVSRTVGSIQYAIQALQSVTDVRVISAPKVLVLDQQLATLSVGQEVPIITQSATSVLTSVTNPSIVNNITYQPTGVILNVTPHINAGGLITLDIEQEVSDVLTTTTSAINSPTFDDRKIQTRVVVQDGETIALGGLIKDTKSVGNSGIPLLRDIPVLGSLFSTQTNSDTRDELLVLITPRIVHDAAGARSLTDELKRKLARPAGLAE